MNADPTKTELRAQFTAARRARTEAEIAVARAAIVDVLTTRWAASPPSRVAAYLPLRTEPGSTELLDALVGLRCTVLLPVLLEDNDLGWEEYRGSGFETSPSGSPQPPDRRLSLSKSAIAECDVVLVPALAVAEDGTRLGRGGGSYDRALARVRHDRPVAALLYTDELVSSLPHDPWDRPVSAVVTPTLWIDLPRLDAE